MELQNLRFHDPDGTGLRNRTNHHKHHLQQHHQFIQLQQLQINDFSDDSQVHNLSDEPTSTANRRPPSCDHERQESSCGQLLPDAKRKSVLVSKIENHRKKQIMEVWRKRAKDFRHRIPTVKDVNKIDKFSRTVFPLLFVVFNVGYWCFYLLQKMKDRLLLS